MDIAIVENQPNTLMGDLNFTTFNHKELKRLEKIAIPYSFHFLNTREPTRKGSTSKSLVNYIISDLLTNDFAATYVFDI